MPSHNECDKRERQISDAWARACDREAKVSKDLEVLQKNHVKFIRSILTLRHNLHEIHWDRQGYCNECGGTFPCSTRRVIEDLDVEEEA